MAILPKISRAKGVEICADLLYSGQSRKEILQHITENYKASEKTVDNWLKEARVIVAERQAEANVIRTMVNQEATEAAAKSLNITQERIVAQYAKIAFYDPVAEMKEIFAGQPKQEEGKKKNDAGDLSGLSFARMIGIKASDMNKALDSLCKVFGYNAPEKQDVDIKSNGQTIHTTFVIKRRSDRDPAGD